MTAVKRAFKTCKEQTVKIILAVRVMAWKLQNCRYVLEFFIPKIGTH